MGSTECEVLPSVPFKCVACSSVALEGPRGVYTYHNKYLLLHILYCSANDDDNDGKCFHGGRTIDIAGRCPYGV